MKLLFIAYFFTGMMLGPFTSAAQEKEVTLEHWAILFGIHVPATLLTLVGIWIGRNRGTFLGLSLGAFLFAALLSYCTGVGIGFWAEI